MCSACSGPLGSQRWGVCPTRLVTLGVFQHPPLLRTIVPRCSPNRPAELSHSHLHVGLLCRGSLSFLRDDCKHMLGFQHGRNSEHYRSLGHVFQSVEVPLAHLLFAGYTAQSHHLDQRVSIEIGRASLKARCLFSPIPRTQAAGLRSSRKDAYRFISARVYSESPRISWKTRGWTTLISFSRMYCRRLAGSSFDVPVYSCRSNPVTFCHANSHFPRRAFMNQS